MKQLVAGLAALVLSTVGALAASPIGQWQVTTGEARYNVGPCGKSLCATLVWLRDDAKTAANLALLNHYVVKGATATSASTWAGNVTVNGHSYDGTIEMLSSNRMMLKGCSGMLCQTYQFTRI